MPLWPCRDILVGLPEETTWGDDPTPAPACVPLPCLLCGPFLAPALNEPPSVNGPLGMSDASKLLVFTSSCSLLAGTMLVRPERSPDATDVLKLKVSSGPDILLALEACMVVELELE